MAGDIHAITNLSNLSVAEHIGITGNLSASSGSFAGHLQTSKVSLASGHTLQIGAAQFSIATIAAISSLASVAGLNSGQLGILFAASGVSLLYRSGNTVYSIASSAQSSAAP